MIAFRTTPTQDRGRASSHSTGYLPGQSSTRPHHAGRRFRIGAAAPNVSSAGMALAFFISLQLLDALTTALFLHRGVSEGNPVVQAAFGMTANPVLALVIVKTFCIGLGVYAAASGRKRVLTRLNVLYTLFVAWNLLAIVGAQFTARV